MMAITSSFSDFDIFLSVYLLEALIDENIPLAALKTRVCIPDENALTFFRIIFFKRKPAPNGGFIPFPCTAKFICLLWFLFQEYLLFTGRISDQAFRMVTLQTHPFHFFISSFGCFLKVVLYPYFIFCCVKSVLYCF